MPNLTCSRCRGTWQVTKIQAGDEVRCPHCDATFRINAPAAKKPAAPAPMAPQARAARPVAQPLQAVPVVERPAAATAAAPLSAASFPQDASASHPGLLTYSRQKLLALYPGLDSFLGLLKRAWNGCWFLQISPADLARHLQIGDCRAAVVVSTSPLLIAAYSDEFDAVAMLRFPANLASQYRLAVGTRLLTVNSYITGPKKPVRDLLPGPGANDKWHQFAPVIADFISDDSARIQALKLGIGEAEWRRTWQLGVEYAQRFPGKARDGRPLSTMYPGPAISRNLPASAPGTPPPTGAPPPTDFAGAAVEMPRSPGEETSSPPPGTFAISARPVKRRSSQRRRIVGIGAVLALCLAVGGGLLWWFDPFTDPHVKVIKERLAYYDRLNGILETVKDQSSADAAAKDILELLEWEKDLQIRARKLGEPEGEFGKQILKEYAPQLAERTTRMRALVRDLPSDPKVQKTVSSAIKEVQSEAHKSTQAAELAERVAKREAELPSRTTAPKPPPTIAPKPAPTPTMTPDAAPSSAPTPQASTSLPTTAPAAPYARPGTGPFGPPGGRPFGFGPRMGPGPGMPNLTPDEAVEGIRKMYAQPDAAAVVFRGMILGKVLPEALLTRLQALATRDYRARRMGETLFLVGMRGVTDLNAVAAAIDVGTVTVNTEERTIFVTVDPTKLVVPPPKTTPSATASRPTAEGSPKMYDKAPLSPGSEGHRRITTTTVIKPGDKLHAEYARSWYSVTALEAPADGRVKVRWDTWGPVWDEAVSFDKLRLPD